jgi:hypothetical protein
MFMKRKKIIKKLGLDVADQNGLIMEALIGAQEYIYAN